MGVSDTSIGRLRGPIGLVPSLRDASSIAVSALTEIVATFQNADV
jgi:xanthine dehydrogenase accessory factor